MSFLSRIAATLSGSKRSGSWGSVGARAYGIGDVHGRLDLLDALLAKVEVDMAERPGRRNFIVFLGDLIDRGPASAGVVERLRTYRHPQAQMVFLLGNHEEVLLRVLRAEPGLLESWLRLGGAECVASYGVDVSQLVRLDDQAAAELLRSHIPAEHLSFLSDFGDTFRFGDYLFVHAGIRPGVPLEQQRQRDLRWIREAFLDDTADHDFVVVHGHTVVDEVEEKRNRIAIDTGAVYTGVLTAIVIEDDDRRYLSTGSAGR